MSAKSQLGDALLKSLMAVREEKGELSIEDMGAILEDMAGTLQPNAAASDRFLQQEIEKMAKYLSDAKHQILSIAPGDENNQHINEASLHLDAVIKTTEEASNSIMDAADEIQKLIAGNGGDTETKIVAETTKIYEACNFQDLTGQRLRKVINTLDYLDEKIGTLAGLFSASPEKRDQMRKEMAKKDTRPDAHLMNGPQLPDQAASQDDIDALFANVKS